MKRYKITIKLLILITLFLAITRVVVSNTISTSGVELGKINENIATLSLENSLISEKLFSESSLVMVASEAAKMGFTEGQEKLVLTNSLPIAAKQ